MSSGNGYEHAREAYATNEKKSQRPLLLLPPDSQSNRKSNYFEEHSRSFCIGDSNNKRRRLDQSLDQDASSSLLVKRQVSKGLDNSSFGSQLQHLQSLVKEFKQISDKQRQDEVQFNDY